MMADLAGDEDGGEEETCGSRFDFSGLTAFGKPAADTAAFDFEPGTRLGDVTLLRLVGEGGMGRVYEGLQGMPCRTVAVKVIHPGVLSPVAMRRFAHEAQILGRLTHPGIARIYSAGMEQIAGRAVPYLVMEHIDAARPLTTYATDHEFSVTDRVRLFGEVCLAVAHGHQRGVIHRDLKPGNVLVDAAGRPRIIDFGVARCIDQDAGLTTLHTAGNLVGTLKYMAPEHFDGADGIDARADVYSLGVMLFELLTGRLPYELTGRSVYEAARTVTDVDPQPLSACGRRFRGDLDTIVATCLEKDRGRRYSTAAELEADLARHLRGERIAASPPRLLDGVIRLARRHRLATAATAGMVVAVVAGLVGVTLFAVQAESARQEAVRQAREAAREREGADRERNRADAEAATARQRLYAANLQAIQSCLDSKNLRLARRLYDENVRLAGKPPPLELHCLAARLDEAAVVIDPHVGPIMGLGYAPDGSRLAATAVPNLRQKDPWPELITSQPYYLLPRDLRLSTLTVPFLFTHAAHLRYAPVAIDEPGWSPRWATPAPGPLAGEGSAAMVEPLAVCPEGTWLAVPAAGGRLRIVDAATGREKAVLEERRGQLRKVAIAAGGRRLATLGKSNILRLWDAGSAAIVATIGGDGLIVENFCFSPDGSRLAIVNQPSVLVGAEILLKDAADGRDRATVPLSRRHFDGDRLVAFSSDGRLLLTSCDEPDLHLWDASDGSPVAVLAGHAATVRAVAFSTTARRIATGVANGHVRVWRTGSWALEGEFMGHTNAVTALAFSPDGTALASGSLDGTIRTWPSPAEPHLAVLPGVSGLAAIAFRPDGGQLAVAARGSEVVELWDPHTVRRLQTLEGPGGVVTHLTWSADGSAVAACFFHDRRPGAVRVWDADSALPEATLAGHEEGAVSVAFSPDGSRVLTTSRAGAASVWERATGRQLMNAFSIPAGPYATKTAAFGLDGTRVVCRSRHVLDAATGEATAPLPLQGQIACVAASADGRTAAIGMAIGHVNVIDVATGVRHAKLVGHGSAIRSIAFSPDATRLATGSLDGMVRLWEIPAGTPLHVLQGHEGFVDAVHFTPDGRRIVTAANDGTVRIWDAAAGRQLVILPGQRETAGAIAVSPDGMRLVTADPAGAVRIWGLSNAAVTAARATAATYPEQASPGGPAILTDSR